MYTHRNFGTCSSAVQFDLIDGKIYNVQFAGGCNGNTQGVARLVEGMEAEEVIRRLSGVHCGMKPTSCPDQLARAVAEAIGR